jgi:hypothetical protein
MRQWRYVVKICKVFLATAVVMSLFSLAAGAQARFDGYFGLGTTQVGSANFTDSFGTPVPTPSMNGVFGTFGGAVMLNPTFGVGAQVSLRFAQGDYSNFGYRPIFYDFNGIWTPNVSKLAIPEFQAGFGGLNMRFYDPSNPYIDQNTGKVTTFAGSSNHLQLHAALGVRFYVKPHIFVRPLLDYHWVRNLAEFGSSSVPSYSIAIGFSSAARK